MSRWLAAAGIFDGETKETKATKGDISSRSCPLPSPSVTCVPSVETSKGCRGYLDEARAVDPETIEERAAIAGHDGGLDRDIVEALAAREAGYPSASALFAETVRHRRAQLTRLAEHSTANLRGPEYLTAAIRFIDEGWAETALARGETGRPLLASAVA